MTQTDMAEAMAEIRKVDPYFSKEAFVKECEFDIIPTVLEVCEGEGGRGGWEGYQCECVYRHGYLHVGTCIMVT